LGKDFLLKKLKQRQQMLDERHEAKQYKNRISQRQKQPKAESASQNPRRLLQTPPIQSQRVACLMPFAIKGKLENLFHTLDPVFCFQLSPDQTQIFKNLPPKKFEKFR
jgi:hypothetical protein